MAFAVALVAGACTDMNSATNLNPEGPPMVRQVRMNEKYLNASNVLVDRTETVFAFGTHPEVTSEDEAHHVNFARAMNNHLRVIMDELLKGNRLEEIECRGVVDDDVFGAVPEGATPDDIARCSTAKDVLPTSCPASNPRSVCICKNDNGCLIGADVINKNMPVGVKDINQDGSADNTSFIGDAVQLKCGSITLPTDRDLTYWYPSGDQNVPALGGFDALGPAIMLYVGPPPTAPMGVPAFYPTNTTCSLVFASSVVDKSDIGVCTPPDGDVAQGCSPGDMSKFDFKIEPLDAKLLINGTTITDGMTGVSRTALVNLKFSAPVPIEKLNTSLVILRGTTPLVLGTDYTLSQLSFDTGRITWTGTGLQANTAYTIRFDVTLTDYWNQPLPQTITVNFTTGA